ncbi:MAG: ribosome recycling factor [Clostridiales bacterium GWF2_38_85]|nr:MAG: ribosome recycling factor [Clostridiales bacterium GWF2_38_85]HBL84889.1 ribosome recycling factor [Clostridiales bacterium]
MKLELKSFEERMKKTIIVFEGELETIRVGRANAKVLDKISVLYYGTPTPVNQMAEIKVPEPRILTITPWDATSLKAIEKAIQISDLGITPSNDGKQIRLNFPQLTEDRRHELTKQVAKLGEDAKVALRNIRREANDKCKEMKKKSEMTEDEIKHSEKETQDLTDKYIKEIDTLIVKKDKEIMEI